MVTMMMTTIDDDDDDPDILIGGAGDDHLYGGSGADTPEGGTGSDILRKNRSDKLAEQEAKLGTLGLLEFFEAFSSQFSQDGFFFVDPMINIPPATDRPVRGWIDDYLSALPGTQ